MKDDSLSRFWLGILPVLILLTVIFSMANRNSQQREDILKMQQLLFSHFDSEESYAYMLLECENKLRRSTKNIDMSIEEFMQLQDEAITRQTQIRSDLGHVLESAE